jgi:hypothetical protein
MNPRELAEQIAADISPNAVECIYRRVLAFLADYSNGYGVVDGERAVARRYAAAHGYYWLPCLICGEWFGGHEGGAEAVLIGASGRAKRVCANEACVAEAVRLREAYPNGIAEIQLSTSVAAGAPLPDESVIADRV